jgi:predicted RNA binding protein YcfA (HicA-like mRNA interferase family)
LLPVKSSELLRILKKDGWYTIRQTGSHMIMAHDTKSSQIVVPFHASKEIKKGTLLSILKDAGIKTSKR